MNRSDAWRKRPVVVRYHAFRDELRKQAKEQDFTLADEFSITFSIPMPLSWSKKRREAMAYTPHQSKPDIDNLYKAVTDCLRPDDSGIHQVCASKVWAEAGQIEIMGLHSE